MSGRRIQRGADALGALAAGADRLACTCGSSDCPAAGKSASAVVINVIAEERTLSDDTPVTLDGENPDKPTKPVREMTLAEAAALPEPTGPSHTPPGVMIGGPVIPAPLLAAKVAAGATIRMVIHPGDAPPEPHHRPSTNLDRFETTDRRGVMMPRRRRTRAHNAAKAKAVERRLNDDYAAQVIAERNKPPPF